MKDKLIPKQRAEENKDDIEAARERQKAEGSESFFDAPLQEDLISEGEEDSKLTEQVLIPKKKFTEVSFISLVVSNTITYKMLHSTNTPRQPSRYRIEN